ncbi:hypothetical protein [Neobacillus sp. 19]|uniref:hypothetical protein n=1 Tax=Neobacillus sp. 19 TaxID=3394458 RepID=UPI003BF644AF
MANTHVFDGGNYVEVDRKANVGDLIVITNDSTFPRENNGKIGKVEFAIGNGISVNIGEGLDYYPHVFTGEYRVLEPLETVDESQASPQVIDMLANLARRVTSLELQLRDTQRNVETFAEQTEKNSEGIRELDERTQSLTRKQVKIDPPTITECYISFSHDGITNLDVSFVGKPSVEELVKVFTQSLNGGKRR